jgi:hypothetical protein
VTPLLCCQLLFAASLETNVDVACCAPGGSSYAKADDAADKPTCFQHVKPGTPAAQCSGAPQASGYHNKGPGSGKLFLAESSSACSDKIQVGGVGLTCPEGSSAKKIKFRVATWARHRWGCLLSSR